MAIKSTVCVKVCRNNSVVWIFFFFFFLKIFGGHESFLWGHWYPSFGLLVTSPLGFKARVGSALFALGGGVRVTLHVPWDSPLVLHLLTSWWPAWLPSRSLPHTCEGIGGTRSGDLSLHERTLNRLSYASSACCLNLNNCVFPILWIIHLVKFSYYHMVHEEHAILLYQRHRTMVAYGKIYFEA